MSWHSVVGDDEGCELGAADDGLSVGTTEEYTKLGVVVGVPADCVVGAFAGTSDGEPRATFV